MALSITRLNPPTLPDAGAMGYSQISIVEPGRMAYVSGQVAWRAGGEPVPVDLVAQTEIAVTNAKAALDALDATPHDIAIVRVFMVGLTPETLEQAFPTLAAMLDGAQPCITGVGVVSLAAPDLLIEIELTVRLPD